MSNALWFCVCIVVFIAGVAIGICSEQRSTEWTKKTIRNLEDLIVHLRGDVVSAQSMEHDAWMSVRDAETETKKYKGMWADELQKRLDLAEKLEKYTGGTPTQGEGDANEEEHSCD